MKLFVVCKVRLFDQISFYSLCCLFVCVSFAIAGVEISFVVCLLTYLAKKIVSRDLTWPISRSILILMVLFLVSSGISFLRSDFLYQSYRGYIRWWKAFLLVIITAETLNSEKRMSKITKLFVIMLGISALDGIFQFFVNYDFLRFQPPVVNFYGTMIRGGFGHYNNYSAYLATFIPISIASIDKNVSWKNSWKMLAIFSTILGSFALWLTSSRSGIVGLLGSMVIVGILFRKKTFFIYFFIFFLWVFARWGGRLIEENIHRYDPLRIEKVEELNQAPSDVELLFRGPSGRIQMWQEALEMSKERLFFGYGPNTFLKVIKGYTTYAHNSYIQILVELGIVGLSLFIVILTLSLRDSLCMLREPIDKSDLSLFAGVVGGLIAFLIHSIFDHDFYVLVLAALFWGLLGVALAFTRLRSTRSEYKQYTEEQKE